MKLPNYNFSTLLMPVSTCFLIKVGNYSDKHHFYDDFTLMPVFSFPHIVRSQQKRIPEPR